MFLVGMVRRDDAHNLEHDLRGKVVGMCSGRSAYDMISAYDMMSVFVCAPIICVVSAMYLAVCIIHVLWYTVVHE